MSKELTERDVAARFKEALYTLKRLPKPRVMGYHTLWPTIVYTPLEILQQEKKRFRLGPPLPKAIDRMEETFTWITWINAEERNLVWKRACGTPWKVLCWEIGCDRSTAWRKWIIALARISTRANKERG